MKEAISKVKRQPSEWEKIHFVLTTHFVFRLKQDYLCCGVYVYIYLDDENTHMLL